MVALAPAREPLSRERVLSAAVALVDAEGLAALTMRKLAADLGVEAMSLYHHVPHKEALLDGLADTVAAELVGAASGAVQSGEGWRQATRSRFLAARTVMLRHPWAPTLLSTRQAIPGEVYAYYDAILADLIDAGFSYRLGHRALHAFGSMPLGFMQEVFSPADSGGSLDTEEAEAQFAAMAEALPHLTAMAMAEMHAATDPTLGWCDSQTEFEFTLDVILDGLDRLRAQEAGA